MATVKTNQGKEITANRMRGTTPTIAEPFYLGVGTAAGTAAAADTTLFTEYTGATNRPLMTSSLVSSGSAGAFLDLYRVVGTYTNASGGAQTITNAGNFDLQPAGTGKLNVKGDFAASATLQIGDSLQVTIDERFA